MCISENQSFRPEKTRFCLPDGRPGGRQSFEQLFWKLLRCFCHAEKKMWKFIANRDFWPKNQFFCFFVYQTIAGKIFFGMIQISTSQRTTVSDLRNYPESKHKFCNNFWKFSIFFKIWHIFFDCREISRARNFFLGKFFFQCLNKSKKIRHPWAHRILSIFSKVDTP